MIFSMVTFLQCEVYSPINYLYSHYVLSSLWLTFWALLQVGSSLPARSMPVARHGLMLLFELYLLLVQVSAHGCRMVSVVEVGMEGQVCVGKLLAIRLVL